MHYCTKCVRQFLQIATAFLLLQSATQFSTNCDRYYKVRWVYYKMRRVLQSAMVITHCDSTLALWKIYRWTNICEKSGPGRRAARAIGSSSHFAAEPPGLRRITPYHVPSGGKSPSVKLMSRRENKSDML